MTLASACDSVRAIPEAGDSKRVRFPDQLDNKSQLVPILSRFPVSCRNSECRWKTQITFAASFPAKPVTTFES
jgi:hypothetical protein